MANVSFVDDCLGVLLDGLNKSKYADNTIVILWGDHGYHLGEHDFWQKLSLHDESARIPLIVSGPGIKTAETTALAQQIDIYPTLAELCGLEVPKHVQGKSLASVIANPKHEVHQAVYCTNKKGHLLRTDRWAYLSWRDGSAELYDMNQDPQQFTNLAQQEEHAATIAKLSESLGKKLQTFK